MIETYKFERFVRVCMFVCLCLCLWNRLFLFLAHKSLEISRYELTQSVDIERKYLSKSGAGSAWFVFLCLKSLEMATLKIMSSTDLVVGLLVWNGCVERLCSSAPNIS